MTRDYYKLEPDKFYPLPTGPNQHFTTGRAGAKVEHITRHHLMYIGEVEDVVDRIWNTRPASAHVVIGPTGRWGQAVGDNSTAWANANQGANQRTIAIEHSNNSGRFGGNDYHDKSWNISDETLIEGARVAAAYCLHYGLGEPKYGTNIRDHNEWTATGCPVHLQGPRAGNAWGGKAGKYHAKWMAEAVSFYRRLKNREVHPDGTPINHFAPPKEEVNVSGIVLGGVSAAALNDAKVAAQAAESNSRSTRNIAEAKYASIINPEHEFDLPTYSTLIDAATWEQRKLSEAIARKLGLDPEQIIEDAIKEDRGE